MTKQKENAIVMIILCSVLLSLISGHANAQSVIYSGNTAASGTPIFNRPADDGSLSSNSVRYQTRTFTPAASGNFRIVSTAADLSWDNFVVVYSNGFNPATPSANFYAANDDFGDDLNNRGISGFAALPLIQNVTYTIVTTGYSTPNAGAYTNTIDPVMASNGDTTNKPKFFRPESSNLGLNSYAPIYPVNRVSMISSNNTHYEAKTFSVTQPGLYRIKSETAISDYDLFTVLYKGTFDPAHPLTNVVIANDDLESQQASGFEIGLDASPQTYTLVTTGYDASQFGQYTWSVQKLYDFRAGFSGSTVGRTGIDISSLADAFSDLGGSGNAVPFRAFRVDYAAGGYYRFQLLSKTFTATAYNPFLGVYFPVFDNNDLESNVDLVYANYPLLDTGDLNFGTAGSFIFVVSGVQNTDAGDFRLEAFGEGAVTITPVAVVNGSVALKTFVDTPPASPKVFPVKMILRPVGGGTNTIVDTVLSSDNGIYLLNIPEGAFNVGIKSPRTLQKVVSNVNATTGIASLGNVVLDGVDSNDDNFSDVTDLLAVINHYNQKKNTPANNTLYKEAADYNFDGVNDVSDLLLIINNYNRSGQFLP